MTGSDNAAMPTTPVMHYAHSTNSPDRGDWQLLEDHLHQTAQLASKTAEPLGLAMAAHLAGELHDIGKYDPAFQRRLSGNPTRVDHSTAGASFLCQRTPASAKIAAEILAYAILGHHAGLPDATGSDGAMHRRLSAFNDRMTSTPVVYNTISAAKELLDKIDVLPAAKELHSKMRKGNTFDLSVAGRMVFSCLVDADYKDTESFYDGIEGNRTDRNWRSLTKLLPELVAAFDAHMAKFPFEVEINSLRAKILAHIRARAEQPRGLFTLTVPTGGGKTFASLGFALDHAAKHEHRRIIYAIPYTSIIDQTVAAFESLFHAVGNDVVLEHHSAIDSDKRGQEGREKARLAMEDWAAPIIVTTNVQFFESLFAARPSRCRKLHNIAGSIIILDEAQCLPRQLLLPALRMIDTLAWHYNCSIVFCSATQPAFDSKELKEGGLCLTNRELAPDPDKLARSMRRARITRGGSMDDAELISALRGTPQGMVIVNSRSHALELYKSAQNGGLDGLIHLTTRQYAAHRRRIIEDIRRRLTESESCRLIATSLIEAGVDLDFPKGWRAEAGLDSLVQSAGRVNREGLRPIEESTLTVFDAPEYPAKGEIGKLAQAMRSVADNHEDLLSPEAVREWFNEVYWRKGAEQLGQPIVDSFKAGTKGTDFPYREVAEKFKLIEVRMVPVIVAIEDAARSEVDRLTVPDIKSGTIARALQPYSVQIPSKFREKLRRNGKGCYHTPELRGDQFFVLMDESLYEDETGLWWEGADYLTDSIW